MAYKLIKSKRKSLSLTVEKDGTVIIKAPLQVTENQAESFYNKNISWIEKRKRHHIANAQQGKPLTERQIKKLKQQAAAVMKEKTDRYAAVMGIDYRSVKITSAKSRWGSCKKDGGICYSYRVMLLSDRARNYIAVHELAHLKRFNHSKDFYLIIEQIMPDYKEIQKEIKAFSNYDLYGT